MSKIYANKQEKQILTVNYPWYKAVYSGVQVEKNLFQISWVYHILNYAEQKPFKGHKLTNNCNILRLRNLSKTMYLKGDNMRQTTNSKKWAIGSVSLILSIFASMFSFTFFRGKYLGEHILNSIGISFPIGVISLVILVISLIIGCKYKNDYLAKSGIIVSIISIFIIVSLTITSELFQ